MENPIKSIYKFNKEAGLLEAGYNHLREPAFLIEEAIESFNTPEYLYSLLTGEAETFMDDIKDESPKELSRAIIRAVYSEDLSGSQISDLEIFDKHIDAFIYTVGSMAKLGLSPQQIEAGIAVVMHSNFKKIGSKKDSEGKQLKPDNWPEIEAEQAKKLQSILDKRA